MHTPESAAAVRGLAARRLALLVSATLLPAVLPATAQASLKASTSIQSSAGVTHIVVKLSSTTKLASRRRPRSVSVRAGAKTKTYALSRAHGASVATVSLGTWRSAGFTGSAATAVLALQGKRVTVLVRTVGGTTTNLASTVPSGGGSTGPGGPSGLTNPGTTSPAPTNPAPTSPQPPFTPPGHQLTGIDAFNSISKYFLNSEFSDCPGGRYPIACAVENRYEHGSSGAWEYHRCQPSSGSDINAYDNLQVTGAEQEADGSWKIEYTVESGKGFYHWEVSTSGAVNGYYIFNGGQPQQLTGLVWRQPAHLGDCYS
jgi:hypothetical protein